jgi:ATP-dependent protease HslVU (ClpYQ) ATPase subunit
MYGRYPLQVNTFLASTEASDAFETPCTCIITKYEYIVGIKSLRLDCRLEVIHATNALLSRVNSDLKNVTASAADIPEVVSGLV